MRSLKKYDKTSLKKKKKKSLQNLETKIIFYLKNYHV